MSEQRAMTASMSMSGKKTNIKHNNREMEEAEKKKNAHIDDNKKDENIILKQVALEKVYEREFGPALEKYNNKQKRKDRKIDNYYKHVKDSKKTNEQQEMIVRVGNIDDILDGTLEHDEAKEMLEEWYEGFEERNPNLKVYNAVIHMDEIYEPDGTTVTTPHIHLNFVPVAGEYKRGLEKQVAFDRALLQQNDEFDKTKPFIDWRQGEVDKMAEIMKSRGIERKEMGTHDSMSVDRYKQVRDKERAVEKTSEALKEKVVGLKDEVDKKNKQFDEREADMRLKALKNDSKESELEKRENNLATGEEALKTSKNDFKSYAERKEQEFKEKEQEYAQKDVKLTDRERELNSRAETLGKSETALNTSKNDFKRYTEQKEQEFKDENLKLGMRATKLSVRERKLEKKESTFSEQMKEKEQEIERKTEEMKAERMRLSEMMKRAHTWTAGKLENMKSHLQKRRQEIELSDDDLMDLNDDKQMEL